MADFGQSIGFILQNEGGWAPTLDGGTMYGITAATARAHGYTGSMERLPLETAKAIYQASYWPGLDAVENQAVATKILDMRVNFGPGPANVLVQRACNTWEGTDISEDGMWGPETVRAVNEIGAPLLDELVTASAEHYQAIADAKPEKAQFLDGWLTRAARIPEDIGAAVVANPGLSGLTLLGIAAGIWYFMKGRA